jgi:TRAP-type C4-dicarboxylate transport system substrate-binding protein
VGGVPELLPAECMIPPGDALALAALVQAVAADPGRWARMSAENLARARDYHRDMLAGKRLEYYQLLRDRTGMKRLEDDLAEAKRLSDLQRPFIEARLARQGLSLLYMVPWPAAGLYAQQPVTSLEQLRGQRFRTFSPATNRFATIVGAQPTLVQAAELAQAFATGVVQAQITSAQTGVDTSSWDYARVFTPLGFTMTKNAVMVSRRAMEALPAGLQQDIRAAAARAEVRGYEMAGESQVNSERTMVQRGMQVIPPTAEFMAGLRRVSTQMTDEWIARAGDDGRALIEAYRRASA